VVLPEEVLESNIASRPRLGAAHASADLGPISPELALVDNVLAERARVLLPDPTEGTRRRRVVPVASGPAVSEAAEHVPADLHRRFRWRRTLLLAGLVFAAGAASGGFLSRKEASSSRVQFEAQGKMRTTPRVTEAKTQSLSNRRSIRRGLSATEKGKPGRLTRPAANVLGVTTAVSWRGVKLEWQRPVDSDHVAVIRALGARRSKVIVFRGRGTSYHDVSAHPCTTYRYTIVNYDWRGHRSTGVPTSVVTQGCT